MSERKSKTRTSNSSNGSDQASPKTSPKGWEQAARSSINSNAVIVEQSTPKSGNKKLITKTSGGRASEDNLRNSGDKGLLRSSTSGNMRSSTGGNEPRSSGDGALIRSTTSTTIDSAANYHSYSQAEISAFATVINQALAACGPVAHLLPIDTDDDGKDLGMKVRDGLLLSSLVHSVDPESIEYDKLNFVKKKKNGSWSTLNEFEIRENHDIFLAGAKKLGIVIVNIHPSTLMEGQNFIHLILGISWQIVRMQLARRVMQQLHEVNEKLRYLGYDFFEEDDEKSTSIEKKAETFLLKWVNSVIVPKGFEKISNFGQDVKNAKAFLALLRCIWEDLALPKEDFDTIFAGDTPARAEKVLEVSEKLGIQSVITADDIQSGNPKLNLLYTSYIFEKAAAFIIAQEEAKRAENELLGWVNSVLESANEAPVHNFGQDFVDSRAYLTILDHVWHNSGNEDFLKSKDPTEKVLLSRASRVVADSARHGVKSSLEAQDVVAGNSKKNIEHCRALRSVAEKEIERQKKLNEESALHWFNEKLQEAGQKPIQNFSSDLQDGSKYTVVLSHVWPMEFKQASLDREELLKSKSPEFRIKAGLDFCPRIGVSPVITEKDVLNAHADKNVKFIIQLKNQADKKRKQDEEYLLQWLNSIVQTSLGRRISNFDGDLKDGQAFLTVFEKVWEEKIEPDVHKSPEKAVKKTVLLSKEHSISVVPSVENILNGNSKVNYDYLWALHDAVKAKEKDDQDKLLAWVNSELEASSEAPVSNFGSDMADSRAFQAILKRNWADSPKFEESKDNLQKAQQTLDASKKVGISVPATVSAVQVSSGSKESNYLLAKSIKDAVTQKKRKELVEWMNLILKSADAKTVSNLGSDLSDAVALATVLGVITGDQSALKSPKVGERADKVIKSAKASGVLTEINSQDIIDGNEDALESFVAALKEAYAEERRKHSRATSIETLEDDWGLKASREESALLEDIDVLRKSQTNEEKALLSEKGGSEEEDGSKKKKKKYTAGGNMAYPVWYKGASYMLGSATTGSNLGPKRKSKS